MIRLRSQSQPRLGQAVQPHQHRISSMGMALERHHAKHCADQRALREADITHILLESSS